MAIHLMAIELNACEQMMCVWVPLKMIKCGRRLINAFIQRTQMIIRRSDL